MGPCGVYVVVTDDFSPYVFNCLSNRPFFFRTRSLARQRAKELFQMRNITWKWVKYKVEPFILSWEKSK